MNRFSLNRRGFLQGAGALSLAAGLGVRPALAGAKTKLKLSHQLGATHPSYQAAERMAAAIEERTGGELSIAIFPNSALGSPPRR